MFELVVDKYFNVVKNRDIKGILTMLDKDKDLKLIMPNGKLIESYENFVTFHEHWFVDEDWSLDVERLDLNVIGTIGTCLSRVTYDDLDEKGKPYSMSYFLYLVFEQVDEQWFLIHDQNTLIK